MLPKKIFQVEFSENYQWFWLGAIVGLSIFGCINYKIVIIIRWQYWIIFIGIEIRFRGPKRRFTIEIINQSFGKCQFFRFISFVKNMSRMSRGPGPGVAGVARATPRFLNLLNRKFENWLPLKSVFSMGYPQIKSFRGPWK